MFSDDVLIFSEYHIEDMSRGRRGSHRWELNRECWNIVIPPTPVFEDLHGDDNVSECSTSLSPSTPVRTPTSSIGMYSPPGSPFGSFASDYEIDLFVTEIHAKPAAVMDIPEPVLTSAKLTELIIEVAARTSRTALFDAFNFFDQDGDGVISADELAQGMASLGDNMTKEEAAIVLHEITGNSRGGLSFEDFIAAALT